MEECGHGAVLLFLKKNKCRPSLLWETPLMETGVISSLDLSCLRASFVPQHFVQATRNFTHIKLLTKVVVQRHSETGLWITICFLGSFLTDIWHHDTCTIFDLNVFPISHVSAMLPDRIAKTENRVNNQ